MIIKLNEWSGDLPELANKVRSTYNYLTGKQSHNLANLYNATASEIRTNPTLVKITKEFNTARAPYSVQIDRNSRKLLMTFDATKVPAKIVDDFKSGGKYYPYINNYSPDSNQVEMIFDVKGELPSSKDYDQDIHTPGGTKSLIGVNESVMAPTPTPYEYEPVSNITTLSVEPRYDEDKKEYYFEVVINNRPYQYVMKDSSLYTFDDAYDKILSLLTTSNDLAYDFIEKNMNSKVPQSTNELIGEGLSLIEDTDEESESEHRVVNYKRVTDPSGFVTDLIWIEDSNGNNLLYFTDYNKIKNIDEFVESEYPDKRFSYTHSSDAEEYFEYYPEYGEEDEDEFTYGWGANSDHEYYDEDFDLEVKDSNKVKNPFKYTYRCKTCGNTIDECICEPEIYQESSATQVSSVGCHKRFSIDMFPELDIDNCDDVVE